MGKMKRRGEGRQDIRNSNVWGPSGRMDLLSIKTCVKGGVARPQCFKKEENRVQQSLRDRQRPDYARICNSL